MRILICDDDSLILEKLAKYLKEYFHNHNIKCPEIVTFQSGEELLNDTKKKDIVFLDIEMPGVSGIFTGKELKQQNPNVIIFIVTSYIEYLDEAMRFHVYRYLSKPIDKRRLFRNMRDALQLYSSMNTTLAIETKQGVHTVLTSSILFVEAAERKVIVHTQNADYESVHTIDFWEKVLNDNCFFRSHRSFIINMKYVTDFDHSLIYLGKQKFTAYLTRRKYSAFKQAYLFYLENMPTM